MNQKDTENSKKKLPKTQFNSQNALAKYSGLGFKMIAIISIGTYGGFLLDKKIPNKYSLFTIFLSLISVFIAMYSVIKDVINTQEKE